MRWVDLHDLPDDIDAIELGSALVANTRPSPRRRRRPAPQDRRVLNHWTANDGLYNAEAFALQQPLRLE